MSFMASITPGQEPTAHKMTEEPKNDMVSKSSLSQEGSLGNGKIGIPSFIVEAQDGTPKHISGRWKTILGHGLLAIFLMIGITVAMLVLVIPFKMDPFKVEDLSLDNYFFLRDIPTSAILCVTSSASLLSIILIPSLLKLASFGHANDLLLGSAVGDYGNLPSTRELAMLIRVLNGNPHAFVQTIRCSFVKRASGRRMMRKATGLYASAILLSIVIIACNFDICASTRALQQLSSHEADNGATNYGRALPIDCLQSSSDNSCQTRPDLHAGNSSEAVWTMKGLSDQNKIVPLDFNNVPNFYNETVMILADARAPRNSLFTATTYGVSTMFMDIGADCQVTAHSWNCSDHNFEGNIAQPLTIPTPKKLVLQDNVVKWVIAAKVQGPEGTFDGFANDPNFAIDGTNSTLFTVMHCETSVWEVDYLKLGQGYIPQSIKPASTAASKIVFGPAFPGMITDYDVFDINDLATEFSARALQSNTTEQLSQGWAESFAKLAISSSAGIMQRIPATKTISIITVVRQAPFVLLGIATLLYGILALALISNAVRAVLGTPGVHDVQARMGISGLMSSALELEKSLSPATSLEELLSDDNHVGIFMTAAGGYTWGTSKAE